MGSELLPKQRAEAGRRGWLAVGGWAVTAAFFWWYSLGFLSVAAAVGAAFLTRRWFQYRAQWGMRF
jgi:hypothetical protein